jgi:hypothetical protein
MSRKHYIRTAAIIKGLVLTQSEKEPIAQQFADMFEEDNPNFDRARFLAAAGVER